jgi:Fungal specific transcription factor domain
MIVLVLAIFTYQMATRNPSVLHAKLVESNSLYSYALSFFPELLAGDSLADMQALALFLIHARTLPQPGCSFELSSTVLRRAIELNYHRSSSKVVLPLEQRTTLAIELRKRVFWSILSVQVTVAVKMGKPLVISSRDIDVEIPQPVLDSEITERGIHAISGNCDFWGHIFLCKKLLLLMNLYENVILARRPSGEYCRQVDALDAQIIIWRQDWDKTMANQPRDGGYHIATHLVDLWFGEFRIILHHPQLCTSEAVDVQNKNLDVCLEASQTILRNVMSMISRFKGADFTWHFLSGYVLGIGMAIHVYRRRREHLNAESLGQMKTELSNWLSVMRNADNYLSECSCQRFPHRSY